MISIKTLFQMGMEQYLTQLKQTTNHKRSLIKQLPQQISNLLKANRKALLTNYLYMTLASDEKDI